MVIQDKNVLPRTINQATSGAMNGPVKQEVECMREAYILRRLNLVTIRPRLAAVFIYCALIAMETILTCALASRTLGLRYPAAKDFGVVFSLLSLFSFFNAFVYKITLSRPMEFSYLSYVYACMYSVVYLPISVFLATYFEFMNFIFIFATAMVSQYYIAVCTLNDYVFTSNKRRLLYWIVSYALQYAMVTLIHNYLIKMVIKRAPMLV